MKTQKQTGFTIVELLIVIVVIAILASISIVAYSGIQQRARDSQRKSDVVQIAKGMAMWSMDKGLTFSQMNLGNGAPANGWFDANYGGGSIQEILQNGNYIARNVNDPKRTSANNSRWRYMAAPCTEDANDNRRVIMTELESPPSETVAQQVSGWGCTSPYINTYVTTYLMNYVRLADAR